MSHYNDALRTLLSDEELAVLRRESGRQNRELINFAIMILQRECHAIVAREAIARGDEPCDWERWKR